MNYFKIYKILDMIFLNQFKNTAFVKSIDKVLSSFGIMKSMERTHVDTFTENRINNIKGDLIAKSNYGMIWFKFQEIENYNILNTTIVSGSNINNETNCLLHFMSDIKSDYSDYLWTLNSDEPQIKSNFSNVSNRWITQLSYHLEKDDIDFIKNKQYYRIQLDYGKKSMPFIVI